MLSYLLSSVVNNTDSPTLTRPCKQGWAKLLRPTGKHGIGKVVYVSLEDYEHFNAFKWSLHCGTEYAMSIYGGSTYKGDKPQYMHRHVLARVESVSEGKITDHIDGNRLNNTRWNLRAVTYKQNAHNSAGYKASAMPFKGIAQSPDRAGFIAQIKVQDRHLATGSVETAEEAAKIYDALARFYRGKYAKTNFVGTEAYDINEARRRIRKTYGSGYSGVQQLGEGKYRGAFGYQGKNIYLGYYPTAESAAQAVDDGRAKRGLKRVNFPD